MSWFSRVKAKLTGTLATSTPADGPAIPGAPGGDGAAPTAAGPADEQTSVAVMMDRASELATSGDRRGAIEILDRVIARAPSAQAYYQRGLAYCELKHYPKAIGDLDRSLEVSPRFAAALTERGLAYVHAGDLDSGLRDYDASILADPSYWLAYENRANVYLMTKRWADVVTSLNIGLRLQPRAEMRYSRGVGVVALHVLPLFGPPNPQVSALVGAT
jgi:tetratricopeptide (TPR) repeat protein